jgi:hypothetical protein
MLSLRNIQAQRPDSQFLLQVEEEEISQNKQQDFPLENLLVFAPSPRGRGLG